jgi:hypothetical protein
VRFYCAILICLVAGLCVAGPGSERELIYRDLGNVPRHPLDPADKAGSVLIFFWQDCPVSNGYAPEMNRIAAGHTNFAFYIVQVDAGLSPAAAKEHARRYDLQIPVLLDPRHRLVKLARATTTPEAVVFGKGGEVLYRGRIDDNYAAFGKKRAMARQHDLTDALDAITAGRAVNEKETLAIGCVIQ